MFELLQRGRGPEAVHCEVRLIRRSRGQSRAQRKGSFCESKTKKSMYMLINMLKKQYHEVNQENLQIRTRIKKVRKERDKVAREVDVMREIREDGHLDSAENQERRRRMLLETEWKQKIKRKAEEIGRVVGRLKTMKKEMRGDHLKQLAKEVKFYANLNRNIGKEIKEKEAQLGEFREEVRRRLRDKRDELRAKEDQVNVLKQKLAGLVEEKFSVKKDFNQLILEEEMRISGVVKKKRVREPSRGERIERVQLKERIKQQIEDIQQKEEQHRELFEEDESVSSLRGLHYTNKNEILLNIDSEAQVEEDILFYLEGGRSLELFLELEGVCKRLFLKRLRGALKWTLQKDKFCADVLVKKLSEKKYGKLPKVLGRVIANVIEMLISVKLGEKEKRNKKIKISKKKKMKTVLEKELLEYFDKNLHYKVFFERGSEADEDLYLEQLEKVQSKMEKVELEKRGTGKGGEQGREAWVRYSLITRFHFTFEEASLMIGSAFWNTKDSNEIRMDDLKRFVKKYVVYLRKKAAKRRKEREAKELEEAAVKIQSVFKGKKVRKEMEERKQKQRDREAKQELEKEEEIPEEICEEIVEEEEIEEKLEEEKEDPEMERAAIMIQGKFRQKMAKRQVEEMKKEKQEKEKAAIMIQKNFKRNQAKKILEEKKKQRQEEEAAAAFIQKKYKQKLENRKKSRRRSPVIGRKIDQEAAGGIDFRGELVRRKPAGRGLFPAHFHDDEPEPEEQRRSGLEQPNVGQLRASFHENQRTARLQRADFGGGRDRLGRGKRPGKAFAGHHGQAEGQQPVAGRGRGRPGGGLRHLQRGLGSAIQQPVLRGPQKQKKGNHVLEPDPTEHPQNRQKDGVEHHEEARTGVPPSVGLTSEKESHFRKVEKKNYIKNLSKNYLQNMIRSKNSYQIRTID